MATMPMKRRRLMASSVTTSLLSQAPWTTFLDSVKERLAALPQDNVRKEAFRYMPSLLQDRSYDVVSGEGELPDGHCFSHAVQIRLQNGQVHVDGDLPDGVTFRLYSSLSDDDMASFSKQIFLGDLESNPYVCENYLSILDGVLIDVAPGVTMDRPLHFFLTTHDDSVSRLHPQQVTFRLGAGATASAAVTHSNSGEHFTNFLANIVLGKESALTWVDANHQVSAGVRFDSYRVTVDAKASLDATFFSSGSCLARLDVDLDFIGEGARAALNGLSMLTGESAMFTRTYIRHTVPSCDCTQLFKAILSGSALCEYNGMVDVAKDAQLSDSSQSNQTLLLSEQARSLSRPQLRIHADDVKAAHGSTTGQLDDKHIFYLQSRGFSKDAARQVLLRAFADDVIDRVSLTMLNQYLSGRVDSELTRLGVE